MALIQCHECGNAVSTTASACPRCGAPVLRIQPPRTISNTSFPDIYFITLLFFVVGAVLGFLLVRSFALDSVEELGLRIFLEGMSRGEKTFAGEDILHSSTFAKLALGSFVSGVALMVLSGLIIHAARSSRNGVNTVVYAPSPPYANQPPYPTGRTTHVDTPYVPAVGTPTVPVISAISSPTPQAATSLDITSELSPIHTPQSSNKRFVLGGLAVLVAAIGAGVCFNAYNRQLKEKKTSGSDAAEVDLNVSTSATPPAAPGETSKTPSPNVLPDGRYSVEIIGHPEEGPMLLVKKDGKPVFQELAIGYILNVKWSPDGRYVAINERRGNCGDYLWILDLKNTKVVKTPNDALWKQMQSQCSGILDLEARHKWGSDVQGFKDWAIADWWEAGDTLVAKVTIRYNGKATPRHEEPLLAALVRVKVTDEGARLEAGKPSDSREPGSHTSSNEEIARVAQESNAQPVTADGSQPATVQPSPTISKADGVPSAGQIAEWRKAAEQGDVKAQAILGSRYILGQGLPNNYAEGVKWLRKAADQGDAVSQLNLGSCYSAGMGVPIDQKEAIKWYLKAAIQGDAEAQISLWQRYFKGDGVPKDDAEAVRWLGKSAEQGNAIAQFSLGSCYASGEGVPKDDAQAIHWWRTAAERGHLQAQTNIGSCYGKGMGVPKDGEESVKWYLKAAMSGHPQAQVLLGLYYLTGENVPMDDAEAVKWFGKAAEQGYAEGQFHFAMCQSTGRGVPKDDKAAVTWYHKAAEQGLALAQANLAGCYRNGTGVAKDANEAVKWYRKAADHGMSGPQYTLATCYLKGEGVPKDYVKAYMWFNLSASAGEPTPVKARDELAKVMSPAQIKEAQRLSLEYKPAADATVKIDLSPNFPSDADAIRAVEMKLLGKGGQVRRIRIAEDWAMCGWIEDPAGGESVLHRVNGNWKHVGGGGGVVGTSELKKLGVPQPLWKKLLSSVPDTEESKPRENSNDAGKTERSNSNNNSLRSRTRQFDDL